jgi:signal transduction histidine kinase
MTSPATRRLALGIGLLCALCVAASLVLFGIDASAVGGITDWLSGPVTGLLVVGIIAPLAVLITVRRPRNAVGWLLLTAAAIVAVDMVATAIGIRGQVEGASPTSWVEWPAWITTVTASAGPLLVLFAILLFPDGHLPGRRWRWVLRCFVPFAVLLVAGTALQPGTTQLASHVPVVRLPLGVAAFNPVTGGSLSGAFGAALGVLAVFVILVAGAVVVRLRRARGVERNQLTWFAYVAVATIAVTVLSFVVASQNPGAGTAVSTITNYGLGLVLPATIALAIIRHGLYDIDFIISRTLVYGSLAVFITAVYVGIAVGIGALVGSGGKPNLGLSIAATAIVAVGFQPVRERVQRVANRLVYGKRATPYEVLAQFSERVAESYAVDDVMPRMARVLAEGTAAQRVDVWLRSGDELRVAASWPEGEPALTAIAVNGAIPAAPAGVDRLVEVRHQGELLGALSITKRSGESLTPVEENLVSHLAGQAGLVLKNVGLTTDLQARLEDLRASRQRLVTAQDEERRKLERNLHDGAQQHLVALKVKLGLAEMLMSRDAEKAKLTLTQLKGDADEALETLRDLARGIYPPLLAEKGLGVALESQARKATIPVSVDADGLGRYAQDVEAAVYFSVLEALQNVQKYAQASQATVRLREEGGALRFEVADDGRGFDIATTARGSGLTNMADRIDALDGDVQLTSEPGRGTQLRGSLPVVRALVHA